ncbi:MAG TPA: PAS domain-containing protein [Chthoniobacteraceae bacterium]|jgi:PAS domain S-box-containing protein
MIDEQLQEQAALYASGAMTAIERAEWELVLESYDELRSEVDRLLEVAAAVTLATQQPAGRRPSAGLKERIMGALGAQAVPPQREGFVLTGADGFVRWVNPEFTAMCGYTAEELRGQKLGQVLQGALTDRVTAERMRKAVHAFAPCQETLINYHKDGTPYWVEVKITPILVTDGQPRFLVAHERELADRAIPAGV